MKKNTKAKKKIEYEIGSGNVFADLGLPDAEELLAKSQMARKIAELVKANGLNQTQAAKCLGINQSSVSRLLNGSVRGFSTDGLMEFLNILGRDGRPVISDV